MNQNEKSIENIQINKEVLEQLEKIPFEIHNLYKIIQNRDTDLDYELKIVNKVLTSKKDIGQLKEFDYLSKKYNIKTLKEIQELKNELSKIKFEKQSLYTEIKNTELQKGTKKVLLDIADKISTKSDLELVKPLLKEYHADTEAMIKLYSGIKNEIKNSDMNIIQKGKLFARLNEVLEEFNKKGQLDLDLVTKINELASKFNNNEIQKIINESFKGEYNKTLMENLSKVITEKSREYNFENTQAYQKFLLGKSDYKTFINNLKDELKDVYDSEKINKILTDIDVSIKEELNQDKIISKLINDLVNISDSSKKDLANLLESYKQGQITQGEFNLQLEKIAKDNDIKTEELQKSIEPLLENIDESNAEKIKEQRRFELITEAAKKLTDITGKAKINVDKKDKENILKSSQNIEDLTYNLTSKFLDKIFGKGTIVEKIFDKITDKVFKKVGGKIFRKLEGTIVGKIVRNLEGSIAKKIGGRLLGRLGATFLGEEGGSLLGGLLGGGALTAETAAGATAAETAAAAGGLSSLGSGLAAAGSFLVTNPIGWAILGAAAIGGASYYAYKKIYGKDKELINKLEKEGAYEYHFFGKSKIKDWSKILELDNKDLKHLIHFGDLDDKQYKMLQKLIEIPEDLRKAISYEMILNEAQVTDKGIHISSKGLQDLVGRFGIPKKELKSLLDVVDPYTKKKLLEKAKSNPELKKAIEEQEKKDKKYKKWDKESKKEHSGISEFLKRTSNSFITPLGTIANAIKVGESMFGGDEYQLIDTLEKMGAVKHYIFGDSEITDWKKIAALPAEDIKKLIEFDDWDKDTLKKLKALYQEKINIKKKHEKIELAKKYLANNMKPELVAQTVHLPLSEVKKLQQTNSIAYIPKVKSSKDEKGQKQEINYQDHTTIIYQHTENKTTKIASLY